MGTKAEKELIRRKDKEIETLWRMMESLLEQIKLHKTENRVDVISLQRIIGDAQEEAIKCRQGIR